MILNLDHIARMNICSLLGMQKANVAEMRAYWALLDVLELTADEKKELEYFEAGNGKPLPGWNPAKSLPPREFSFTEAEGAMISKAVEGYPQFQVNDGIWLRPLLKQLSNGHAPDQ